MKRQRDKHKKAGRTLVGAWLPDDLIPALDRAVSLEDSDKSKFLRNALRDRIARHGIDLPTKTGGEPIPAHN